MLKIIGLQFIFFIFCVQPSLACQAPSVAEANAFFSGADSWTLVDGAETDLVHQRKEVVVRLDFRTPSNSSIDWNGGPANVRNLQVCKTGRRQTMEIHSNWPKIRLSRLAGGRLQARALGIRFYFRPSHRVIWE